MLHALPLARIGMRAAEFMHLLAALVRAVVSSHLHVMLHMFATCTTT